MLFQLNVHKRDKREEVKCFVFVFGHMAVTSFSSHFTSFMLYFSLFVLLSSFACTHNICYTRWMNGLNVSNNTILLYYYLLLIIPRPTNPKQFQQSKSNYKMRIVVDCVIDKNKSLTFIDELIIFFLVSNCISLYSKK